MAFAFLLIFLLCLQLYFLRNRQKSKWILQVVIWLGIILGTTFIFSVKDSLLVNEFVASLIPGHGYSKDSKTIVFKKAKDGHFYVTAHINGAPVKFMVDTGATDIALTRDDAKRIGIDLNSLQYTKQYNTANGAAYFAPVKLKEFTVKNLIMHNLSASVAQDNGLDISLLGMGFLEEFTIVVSDDTLTIMF